MSDWWHQPAQATQRAQPADFGRTTSACAGFDRCEHRLYRHSATNALAGAIGDDGRQCREHANNPLLGYWDRLL
jgi:hypothetical protein